jgi:hypothetical protein
MLLVNEVLEYVCFDSRQIRVLWISSKGDNVVTFEISNPKAFPVLVKLEVLLEEINEGKLKIIPDPLLNIANPTGVSDKSKSKRDRNWMLIRDIVNDVPAVFLKTKRHKLVSEAAKKNSMSHVGFYRLMRRYWARGQTINALLPDYKNSGGKGKQRIATSSSAKRGRPVQFGSLPGMNTDESLKKLFRIAIQRRIAQLGGRFSLAAAYEDMVKDFFSDVVIDENDEEIVLLQKQYRESGPPTYTQFYYWMSREADLLDIRRKRLGDNAYNKDMRGLPGTSAAEVWGPGARYQIDATLADVYIVSKLNRRKVIGRPVIYVVVDVFSRMVVGLYVGIEGPSWVTAMMALANAASDKVEYCAKYGIEIEDADWPCKALPAVLLGDRGEIASHNIETLEKSFNVFIENAAPYRADWKGIVEKKFNTIPLSFKPYAPGYVRPQPRQRGERDHRLDAKLNLDEFTQIVITSVLAYNNNHEVKGYDRSVGLVRDDVPAIPIDLWEWGCHNASGVMRSYPSEAVKFALMPTAQATVTVHGIKIFDLYYACREVLADKWLDRARQEGQWKVTISYDPRSADTIYLHYPKAASGFVVCSLSERSRAYRAGSFWDSGQSFEDLKIASANNRVNRADANSTRNKRIQDVIKKATEQTEAAVASAGDVSDREVVKSIRKNRAEERQHNRLSEAFKLGGKTGLNSGKVLGFSQPNKPDYSTPNIAELLSGFEEDGDE